MGRRSLLHVAIQGQDGKDWVLVGGEVTPVMEDSLTL
jgi:predicted PhzF superfamily epimerase YddE/YHI9